jgi:hypothetical protein
LRRISISRPRVGIEHHHRLHADAAVLRAAEADHVDPGLPRHLGRACIQRRAGIGEPRAVEMRDQPRLARDTSELCDVIKL